MNQKAVVLETPNIDLMKNLYLPDVKLILDKRLIIGLCYSLTNTTVQHKKWPTVYINCIFLYLTMFVVEFFQLKVILKKSFFTYHLTSFVLGNNSVSQLEEQHHHCHPSSGLQVMENKVIACLKDGLVDNAPK